MAESLEVGMKLHAKYSDGEFYPAIVEAVSTSKNRAKAPVKVSFVGFEGPSWMAIADLKSKKLPKNAPQAEAKAKSKAKDKEKVWDYSGLEKGMSLEAESDGKYYSAEVLAVKDGAKKSKAPVKVRFVGYTAASDEWVGADRLRSKALTVKKDEASQKSKEKSSKPRTFSLADQTARFERAQKEGNKRFLDITSVYDGSYLKGKRVLIVGASKGLGLEMVKELVAQNAECIVTCRKSTPELESMSPKQVITDVEVTDSESMKKMASQVSAPLDYVIFNAGYFPDIADNLDSFPEKEALKQIDINALGPIRCIVALKAADLLKGAKVAVISSQAGSAAWRFTQNKGKGTDYGHHMSRAACNIGAALMSEELGSAEVPVVMLHPGFNRTGMTAKYAAIWDKEGAVEPPVGAKRVLHELKQISMKTSGHFINCEDGLRIPF